MDYTAVNDFRQFVQDEIRKHCISLKKNDEKHNHPPVRFLVQDCEYCKKYGNVFVKPQN